MNRYSGLVALLLGILPAGPVGAAADPDPAAVLARLGRQRRDAARRTYEVLWVNYREGRASGEMLYRWSLRWLEAERQLGRGRADRVAAFKGHRERMRQLEMLVWRVRQRSGQATRDEASAAEYFLAEAEVWLLQAEGKKDP